VGIGVKLVNEEYYGDSDQHDDDDD